MARLLAALYFAGATLALLSILLPHSPQLDARGITAVLVTAYLASIGLFLAGAHVPRAVIHAIIAQGTILIAAATYFSGDGNSYFSLFYVWTGLYAFYFFPARQAMAQVAFVAVVYAVLLNLRDGASSPVTPWILTVGTIAVAGTLVARLVAEIRTHAADLALVATASHDVLASTDAAAARSAICASARTVAGAVAAALFEPGLDVQTLDMSAGSGLDGRGGGRIRAEMLGEATRVLLAARPDLRGADLDGIAHSESDARLSQGAGSAAQRDFGAYRSAATGQLVLCRTIIREDTAIGVLAVAVDWRFRRVARRAWATIGLLAAEAAVAIDHADLLRRLDDAAQTDHLTGLANRRVLFDALPRELARATREHSLLSVAMLDLDHFKEFNDTHGHQAGDRHLKEAAAAWRELLRPADLLVRYGGEEFTLVLPGCALYDAIQVTERIRLATPGGQTCSAGVAEWDGSAGGQRCSAAPTTLSTEPRSRAATEPPRRPASARTEPRSPPPAGAAAAPIAGWRRVRAGATTRRSQVIGAMPSAARVSEVVFVRGNGSSGTARPRRSQIGSQPSPGSTRAAARRDAGADRVVVALERIHHRRRVLHVVAEALAEHPAQPLEPRRELRRHVVDRFEDRVRRTAIPLLRVAHR